MSAYRFIALAALALLAPARAKSQSTNTTPAVAIEGPTNLWEFSASVSAYLVPDSRDYVNPNFTADRGLLHLEARYNYEALETGSVWVGCNFSIGDRLVFEATPMLGGVFGNLTGVAPGYTVTLSYKRFSLWGQGEYVVDTGDSSGNFFYAWTELSYSPLDWLRGGLVMQRTRAFETELDIQRGFFAGASFKKLDFTIYVFNLGWTDPTLVFSVGTTF